MFHRALSSSGGGSAVAQKIVFSGTASGNGNTPANAFDGNPTTRTYLNSNMWVAFKFNQPVKANIFGFKGHQDSLVLNPTGINVSVSEDNGNTWKVIARGGDGYDSNYEWAYCCCENNKAYDYYKFDCMSRSGGGYSYAILSEIAMYYLEGLKFGN